MKLYKLISIVAVAMLITCPLFSLASDAEPSADATTEKGYYFELSKDFTTIMNK